MYSGLPYAYKDHIDEDDMYVDMKCNRCYYKISKFLYNTCDDGIHFYECNSCHESICSECEIPRMGYLKIFLDQRNDLQKRAGLAAGEFLVWSKYINKVKLDFFQDIPFKEPLDTFFGVIDAKSRKIRQIEQTKIIDVGEEDDDNERYRDYDTGKEKSNFKIILKLF